MFFFSFFISYFLLIFLLIEIITETNWNEYETELNWKNVSVVNYFQSNLNSRMINSIDRSHVMMIVFSHFPILNVRFQLFMPLFLDFSHHVHSVIVYGKSHLFVFISQSFYIFFLFCLQWIYHTISLFVHILEKMSTLILWKILQIFFLKNYSYSNYWWIFLKMELFFYNFCIIIS